MLDAGWGPDHVAGADLALRLACLLDPARAERHDERLTEWMGMPRRPRARLEVTDAPEVREVPVAWNSGVTRTAPMK
jgi:hypothetical protein